MTHSAAADAQPGPTVRDAGGPVQAMNARTFNRHLAAVRRWGVLACPAPKQAALERWARWRTDTELNMAAVVPDHSQAGQAAAAAALAARGGTVTGLELTAPSFLRHQAHKLTLNTFFGWAYRLRQTIRFSLMASFAVLLGALAVMLSSEHVALRAGVADGRITAAEFNARYDRVDITTRNADQYLERMAGHPAALRARIGRDTAAGATLVFLGSLGLWALAVQLRRCPARVLVLRPEARRFKREQRRLIEHDLRAFGHVSALSERPVKRTRVAWTPAGLAELGGPFTAAMLVLLTPIRIVGRILDKARLVDALVASAQDYRSLARRLIDRSGQNFAAEMTTRETIVARPTEAWRRETAGLLIRSSDVVIADVTALEVEDMKELSALMKDTVRGRFVLMSDAEDVTATEARLQAAGLNLSHPLQLYTAGRGPCDRRTFRETILAAMRSRLSAA